MSLSIFDPFAPAVDASLLAAAGDGVDLYRTAKSLGTPVETTPEPLLAAHDSDPQLRGRLRLAILRGRTALRETQQPSGAWETPQKVPTPLLVETLLALAAIGEDGGEFALRCVALLKSRLNTGIDDANAVLVYLMLKIYRVHFPNLAEMLALLRKRIDVNTISATARLWLAVFGQVPYRLRDIASFTPLQRRACAAGVVCNLEPCCGVAELVGRPPKKFWSRTICRWVARIMSPRSTATPTHSSQTTLLNVVTGTKKNDLNSLQQLAQIESLFVTDVTGELALWNGDALLSDTALAANVLSADGARTNEVARAVAWGHEAESSGSVESLIARIQLESCFFAATTHNAAPSAPDATPDLRLIALAHSASLAGAKRRVVNLTATANRLQDDIRELAKLQSPNGLWDNVVVTARVLAAAGKLGLPKRSVDRAVAAIKRLQQSDGHWRGDDNDSLLTTATVVAGLAVVVPANDESLALGVNWILSQEWCKSGDAIKRVATILSALIAAGRDGEPSVVRGVETLLARQNGDGVWADADHSSQCHAILALAGFARAARDRLRSVPFASDRVAIPIRAIRLYLERS